MLNAYQIETMLGPKSVLAEHFGRAPRFLLVESETGAMRSHTSEELREAGECAPIAALSRLGVREIHCRRMGRGALRHCFEAGIQVFQSPVSIVRDALAARTAGACPDLPDTALCGDHDHHHDHDCGHHHAHE